eukprot:TRINITY_DN8955_c0_g2_i1.p1 TRINITY_DN8955_c0_g2~~TRINITY_DN8955_c0_g2_i1.p1  ORF type:complete len:279 (-),score=70.45 TRINITY_DN8955_c0_g2_i1:58-894(-)
MSWRSARRAQSSKNSTASFPSATFRSSSLPNPSKVLSSVYRTLYNLPKNISPRKPNSMLYHIVNSSEDMGMLTFTLENSLDPFFIYFDSRLSKEEASECTPENNIVIKRINGLNLPESKRFGETHKLRQLSQELQANDPPVCFMVGDQYSVESFPGFMAIPYRVSIGALVEFYKLNKQTVQAKAKEIIEKYKPALATKEKLQSKHNITAAEFPSDSKEWKSYEIALKHLEKLVENDENMKNRLYGMRIQFGKEYKINNEDTIELPLFFNNDKLRSLLN